MRTKQKKINIDKFVREDLKWTHNLKHALDAEKSLDIDESGFRRSLWRPFCKKWVYFDRALNERVYLTPGLFPTAHTENIVVFCTIHNQMPFTCIAIDCLPNEAVGGRNGQCFGLYTYSPDGQVRLDNVTDWAEHEFRNHYEDRQITKRDIFNYVYALLHHPRYREYFAANLQKEIPRVPQARDFRMCAEIGGKLVDLHVTYENAKRYELKWIETPGVPLSYRVTGKMVLDKEARSITVNDSLMLAGIPGDAFEYILGTRSALEWLVDQYRLEKDDDDRITSDPNDPENEEYVVQLIERVTTVSLETLSLIRALPPDVDFTAPGRKRKLSMSLANL